MEFSIATLLSNFTDNKLVAPKVLEKKMDCVDERSLRKLQIALDALEKIGILVKERGRYRRVSEDDIVEAKLRCSSKGFCFAIQDIEGAEDIYIRESNLSTAWNGDRVLVRTIKEGSRRRSPEGEVRLILERSNPSVLARVKQANSHYRAVPLDDRLLFEIDLKANGVNLQEAIDHLVHVEVTRYPLGSLPPVGRVAQVLGSDAEAANDIDIVCCKHDLPRRFSDRAIDAAAKVAPSKLRKTDMRGRQDLRELPTYTFVPERDLDPYVDRAISLERQGNEWHLGVHVTDISRYVEAESPIDREAYKRGTTVFLGDTVLPLLPELLAKACTFVPGEDRLAISALMTLDDDGRLKEFELQPTVVSVKQQWSYPQVQGVLDGKDSGKSDLSDDERSWLELAWQVSLALKQRRHERGAFELNLPEVQNRFNDEGTLGATVTRPWQASAIICEAILLANQCVGAHLRELGLPAIFRVHPSADIEAVQELLKLASNLGVKLELDDEETVRPEDFVRFTRQFASSKDEKILTYLLEDTLRSPYYSIHPSYHFGLALETGYAHFTSPLHRYPDLIVQRLLQGVFEQGRDRRSTRSKDRVNLRHSSCHGKINWNVLPPDLQHEFEDRVASKTMSLSEREKLAVEAEEDLQGLQKAGAMKERTGEMFQGLITGVQSYGFFVEIEVGEQGLAPSRLEGLVHVSSLKDDWYEYRSRQQTLVGRKNRKQYRLGDRVEVQIKSVDYYRQQIDLAPVGGGSEATDDDDPREGEEE